MLISRHRRFIFIHIYKTGGSSIYTVLSPHASTPWRLRANAVLRPLHISYFDPEPLRAHVTAQTVVKKIGRRAFESCFSFAFVRNPWDWLVSHYEYVLGSPEHYQHPLVRELGSFEAFIKWRCTEAKLQKDFICSPDGEVLTDFVGKFENIEEDFKYVCSKIGLSLALPRINASARRSYEGYYSNEARELVREVFQPDIAMFGYEFGSSSPEVSPRLAANS